MLVSIVILLPLKKQRFEFINVCGQLLYNYKLYTAIVHKIFTLTTVAALYLALWYICVSCIIQVK